MKASVFSLAAVAAVASAHSNDTMVTSTILATSTSTILSCAPTVTDCPVGSVTEVVYATTTICPATAVYPPAPPATITPVGPSGPSTQTFYSTAVYTITSCAPTVTDCPVGKPTSTVYTSTVVCDGVDCTKPTSIVAPPASSGNSSSPATTLAPPVSTGLPYCPTPITSYITVTASPSGSASPISTPYVCPGGANCPAAPATTSTAAVVCPGGANCPSVPATTVVPVVCPGGANCPPTTGGMPVGTGVPSAPANSTTPIFTGGASAQKAGSILMAVGLAAALL